VHSLVLQIQARFFGSTRKHGRRVWGRWSFYFLVPSSATLQMSLTLFRIISVTARPNQAKFWNKDPIFARIMIKEIMQIDRSPFCPLFPTFSQFYNLT
jgi:hypothetical protein